jgi:hypothetical protein
MKPQQLIFGFFLWLVFSLTKVNAQTVYITDSGKKYHAKNCSAVKTGKKGIPLKEAKKEGYEPCKVCKADEIISSDVTEEKKKNGSKK